MIHTGAVKTRNGIKWYLQVKMHKEKAVSGGRAGQHKPDFHLENIIRQLYSEVWNNVKYLGCHVQYNECSVLLVLDQFSHD